jgi:hypothetical protein
MESPGRTNDDETSPPDLVDDVDLELGVCPACLAVAGLVQLLPRFLACLYFTEVPKTRPNETIQKLLVFVKEIIPFISQP